MSFKIPLFKTHWDQSDINSISEVIKRGTYWATGPEIIEFEQKIADSVRRKFAVSFNSGTSALHAVLLAYKITSGEVIVPSFTFISTANAVILAGAKPVFSETEGQTFGLDKESIKEKITPKTKAIIPIHYGGLPSKDIEAMKEIAEDKKILLIEDAAESLGSKSKGKMAGSFGDAAMFSFCQNKVITTGEGGMIVTDSKKVYERLKLIRSHGRVETLDEDYFSTTKELDYIDIGYNYRMPTMNAALGLSQFSKIDGIIEMRRTIAHKYSMLLKDISAIKLPVELPDQKHVYQMFTIQLPDKRVRNNLQDYLSKKGVMSKVYFYPIHLKSFYRRKYGYRKNDLPRTERLSEKVLTLPLYPDLTEKELQYISDHMHDFFN